MKQLTHHGLMMKVLLTDPRGIIAKHFPSVLKGTIDREGMRSCTRQPQILVAYHIQNYTMYMYDTYRLDIQSISKNKAREVHIKTQQNAPHAP